jgi:septal ring factor EnvC (AmiA/AmiB activator)
MSGVRDMKNRCPALREERRKQNYAKMQSRIKSQREQIKELQATNSALRVRLALELNCDPTQLTEY